MESIAEKPDWYFARQEIPRLDAELESFVEEAIHFDAMIEAALLAGRWPRNTDACRRWGKCPYFGPCTEHHMPLAQGVPSGFVKIENIHAELTIGQTDHEEYADDNSAA
jgi:hypothetical protein